MHASPLTAKHTFKLMGSLVGPVLADISMAELQRNIIPTLSNNISLWKRYLDKLTFIN